MMFYCRKTSDDRSDATASYEWDVPKRATVRDFVEYKIGLSSPEFGTINFCPKYRRVAGTGFKYSNFKDLEDLLNKYGDRLIKGPIKANGGWSHMDYWIELIEEVASVTNMMVFKAFLESTKIDKNLINDWRPCLPEYEVPYIPMAIVIWLKDKSSMIYIYKEEIESGK